VLDAKADAAASGLLAVVDFDIKTAPVMQWRWKIRNLIDDQDNSNAAKEDSPLHIAREFAVATAELVAGFTVQASQRYQRLIALLGPGRTTTARAALGPLTANSGAPDAWHGRQRRPVGPSRRKGSKI
jgi:hypothetical protein